MKLSKLTEKLSDAQVLNHADPSIVGFAIDSRKARPGCLFAALAGRHNDGTAYVPDAIQRGAVAILASRPVPVPSHIPLILAPNVRRALADLCCRYYGYPADLVKSTAVTGTNGKSTTVLLCRELLLAAGKQCGLISTVGNMVGATRLEATNTTPESPDLQQFFAELVEHHISHAVVEVSSHALDQERVRGIPFAVAAYTNVTRAEHLDYHGTFENYRDAKARLFEALAPEATAVLNADDPNCGYFRERRGRGLVLTYGVKTPADVTAEIEGQDLSGTSFRLSTPLGATRVHTPLVGSYNVENVLAAISCGLALGLELHKMAEAVRTFTGAPGRLQKIEEGQPFTCLVDYAHNEGGLRSVLGTLRPLAAPGRLIVAFGCGGDRDRMKRPLMGAAASELADVVVLTSDNSRSERTEDILAEILKGVSPKAECIVEPDRRKAIRRALELAQPGDVVAICGKGHERFQEVNGVSYPFDDCAEARRALRLLSRRARKVSHGPRPASEVG